MKGHKYFVQKQIDNLNVYISGDERNANGALDVIKEICKSFELNRTKSTYDPVKKYKDIKEVDFYNFKYPDISVKDSVYFYSTEAEDDYTYGIYKITGIIYGDLTGDKKDEAVISNYWHAQGTTGQFTGGYVYTLNKGKPELLYTIEDGDRAAGGINNIKIKNGLLEIGTYEALGPLCCPEYVTKTFYKWKDTTFVPVDCEMYTLIDNKGNKTIKFSPGNNDITLSDTTDNDVLYTLSLEKGDSISIESQSVNKKKINVELVLTGTNDSLVVGGCNQFASNKLNFKVNKTGNYYLRVFAVIYAGKAYLQTKIKKIIL